MASVGERLKAERERLGYNQSDFGECGGKTKLTQSKYENNETSPTADYLLKIQAIGADMIFILTGQRSSPMTLPPDEAALLDNYRNIGSQEKRDALKTVSSAFAQLCISNQNKNSA